MPELRRLPRLSPHSCGVVAGGIADFLDSVEQGGPEVHSLMVVRHGAVVAEGWRAPYGPGVVHEMFSLTKAFASTAIGFARAEGLLDLGDLVLDHLRDLAPAHPDANLERMTVRHLLTMTTGHAQGVHDALYDLPDWERAILALPVEHEPGTEFTYNSAATYLLGAILHRRTGLGLAEYLRPRLFEPLGIADPRWELSPSGLENGGFGLSLTTEDIACFGQLYLDGGRWQGAQVLPVGWAQEATALQVPSHLGDADWERGYGYAFWQCRHGAVRGDGAFGQFCVLLPEHDAVVVITSGTPDLQGVLDRVWAHLLPALAGGADAAVADEATLADEAALAARLAAWRFEPPSGSAMPGVDLTGRTVALEPNELGYVSVTVADAGGPDRPAVVQLKLDEGDGRDARVLTLQVGLGDWAPGTLTAFGSTGPVVAAAGWSTPHSCVVQVRWPERPLCLTVDAAVDGERVRATAGLNVRFHGPTDLGTLTGSLV